MTESTHHIVLDDDTIDSTNESWYSETHTQAHLAEGERTHPSSETPSNRGNGMVSETDENDVGDALDVTDIDNTAEVGTGEEDNGGQYSYFGVANPGDGPHAHRGTPEEIQLVDERRRETLILELQKIQRTNFIHFAVLFLVPTALIILVIWSALSMSRECDCDIAGCTQEPRKFVHAFTSRCLCEAFEIDS
mmetsp:Transcript_30344/g.36037  ORF Transcript_30344/g.36037 Transcript_30344/m.36037 type:complete len:192 (-) Transcript_30344:263-838(-)|eukprot:CAMPEP_0198258630 /NCGR_PEP_ID=MMETSP1447-20131203/8005_1 /TAXON_ID=420782 /ORGANISM="Chaetoceros dichaeta, Strain CCMP1751" /LENGTH=191 /DNA_ID=CAMNT_0043945795 /DNA_START=45 /DNA_END=620 /DNA_ORIENTATION=+